MSPLDAITLKAFLAALYQLKSPLPAEFQQQLRELGTAPFNFEKMHELGTQPPLARFYESAWDRMQLSAAESHLCDEPILPDGDDSNRELTNFLDGLEREDFKTIEEMSQEIFQAIQEAETTPQEVIIPIFKRWML